METDRLIIRRFNNSDLESAYKNWASRNEVQKEYGEETYASLEDFSKELKKYIDEEYRFAIILKENMDCIGQIAYFLYDKKNNFAEIEYCVGTDYQNKGYATEATKEVIKYGFEVMNLHKVQICHRPVNVKSKCVILKCGFTYEGTLRDYFCCNGLYQDRIYYSILYNEYKGLKYAIKQKGC